MQYFNDFLVDRENSTCIDVESSQAFVASRNESEFRSVFCLHFMQFFDSPNVRNCSQDEEDLNTKEECERNNKTALHTTHLQPYYSQYFYRLMRLLKRLVNFACLSAERAIFYIKRFVFFFFSLSVVCMFSLRFSVLRVHVFAFCIKKTQWRGGRGWNVFSL